MGRNCNMLELFTGNCMPNTMHVAATTMLTPRGVMRHGWHGVAQRVNYWRPCVAATQRVQHMRPRMHFSALLYLRTYTRAQNSYTPMRNYFVCCNALHYLKQLTRAPSTLTPTR